MLIRMPLALAAALLIAVPVSAADPALRCQSSKNKEAGKYANCLQKAEAKFALTADGASRTLALQRCVDKLSLKWPLIEQKAIDAGGACLTTGDQGGIQGVTDPHVTNIATALAGGTLHFPQFFPATGQTTCWDTTGTVIACAGTGHDGDVQAGSTLAYIDNGNGTITDDNTGLMWEKLSDDGSIHDRDNTYSWSNAFAVKVATLNAGAFAGHTDWRMPNVKELQSIVDYGIAYPGPTVASTFNTGCVPGCSVTTCSCTVAVSGLYWSSSTIAGSASFSWAVYFADGNVNAYPKTDAHNVRAVRGGS